MDHTHQVKEADGVAAVGRPTVFLEIAICRRMDYRYSACLLYALIPGSLLNGREEVLILAKIRISPPMCLVNRANHIAATRNSQSPLKQ